MTVDMVRYNRLIASAAFDCSFYTGSIQDRSSPAQRAMSLGGGMGWTRVNGIPCLAQRSAGDVVQSGVVASVVDCATQPYFAEVVFSARLSGFPVSQIDTGGWRLYYNGVGGIVFGSLSAAYAWARYLSFAVTPNSLTHVVCGVNPVGLSGTAWINGVPVAPGFTNGAVPANCNPTLLHVGGYNAGPTHRTLIARVWQGTPSNEDVAALHGAARALTGGEV